VATFLSFELPLKSSNQEPWSGVIKQSRISVVLRAATGDCDPVYGGCRCGLPYFLVSHKKVAQSWRIFATVTGSPGV